MKGGRPAASRAGSRAGSRAASSRESEEQVLQRALFRADLTQGRPRQNENLAHLRAHVRPRLRGHVHAHRGGLDGRDPGGRPQGPRGGGRGAAGGTVGAPPPSRDVRLAIVSTATIFPRSMIPTRPHSCSTSDSMWEDRKIVLPSLLSHRIRSRKYRMPAGSRPFAGSSMMRTSGSWRRHWASARRFFIPWLYALSFFLAASARLNRSRRSFALARASPPAMR